jgi:hypothetical protein
MLATSGSSSSSNSFNSGGSSSGSKNDENSQKKSINNVSTTSAPSSSSSSSSFWNPWMILYLTSPNRIVNNNTSKSISSCSDIRNRFNKCLKNSSHSTCKNIFIEDYERCNLR